MCVVLVYFSILLDKGTKVLYTHDNYWLVILVFYFLAFGSIMRISGRTCSKKSFGQASYHNGLQNFSKESPVGVNLEKRKHIFHAASSLQHNASCRSFRTKGLAILTYTPLANPHFHVSLQQRIIAETFPYYLDIISSDS